MWSVDKGVPKNFCDFHRKTPVLQSLFNKIADLLSATTLFIKDYNTGFLLWNLQKIFRVPVLKNICERPTASLIWKKWA